MWLVALGVLALVLKLVGWTVVASWSWWLVLSPFAAAALWWTIADLTGLTRRDALQRHEARVQRRRRMQQDALGMTTGPDSKSPREPRRD